MLKIDKDVFPSCHARWTKKKSAHEEPSLDLRIPCSDAL